MLSALGSGATNVRHTVGQVLNFALVLSTAFMLWYHKPPVDPRRLCLNSQQERIEHSLCFKLTHCGGFVRIDVRQITSKIYKRLKSHTISAGSRHFKGETSFSFGTEALGLKLGRSWSTDIPIVHRVVRTYPELENKTKKVKEITTDSTPSHLLLTKGDNNVADDTELYAQNQDYLNRSEDIVGSVRGYIPGVGFVTIMLSEYPWLKTALLGLMGLMVLLQRE
ncbi:Signal peptidase complex catalytic subunit [Penicillium chermesinum]|uniref:Signal peptidase complex catalytic subunit SEC11 n=1 Tax=Penicillium chermesinum TaxID=63820 RepID=A0A9W9P949_9EURO|nr:Signal peptidase complex catalytic subunit [Penicillium chermesinum]KAJ5240000.1 Signal peptidase complex catalytic subunit [Penicillium chermesinum]